jgi:hypothetical protein
MDLPFTTEQFLDVFKIYNLAVWPAQYILLFSALLMIFVLLRRMNNSNLYISLGLVFLWLWMGIVYQISFFTAINKAAYIFGTLFILQGLLFYYSGVLRKEMLFEYQKNFKGIIAIIFFLYALIFYPLLSYTFGHKYPYNPTFGLPCPTTIFTFGVLLLMIKPKKILFIIPLVWSVIGFTAARKLGIFEDIGLLVAGIVSGLVVFAKRTDK